MQDPDLLRRRPTRTSSLCGYIAASAVAAMTVVQALSAAWRPGESFSLSMLPPLLGYGALLACVIAAGAAVPVAMTRWMSKQYGKTPWKMFAIVGAWIGLASFLVFLTTYSVVKHHRRGMAPEMPDDDLTGLIVVGGCVAALAGGAASVFYRVVAGYERAERGLPPR